MVAEPAFTPSRSIVLASDRPATIAELLALAVLAALISVLFTGYLPVYSNNIYHLPILEKAWAKPEFAADAFVQSLRYFSSGFWLSVAGVGQWVEPRLFLGMCFALSRIAFFMACFAVAAALGYRGLRVNVLFAGLLAASSLLRGATIGEGALNIDYFSHSELANATLLTGFAAALAGRFGLAAFVVCVTFFLNAFMAVWMLPPLALAALLALAQRQIGLWVLILRVTAGVAAGAPVVAPVLASVLGNPEAGRTTPIPYEDFLWGFYPYHFFVESFSRKDLAFLAFLLAALGVISAAMGRKRAGFAALALGACAVLAIGAILPHVSDDRFLLNLHLMRSAVVLQLLVGVGAAILVASRLADARTRSDNALALLMTAAMALSRLALPALVLLLALDRFAPRLVARIPGHGRLALLGQAFAALLAAGIVVWAGSAAVSRSLATTSQISLWAEAGDWARANTAPNAVFLLPVVDEAVDGKPASVDLVAASIGFVETSKRSIWIQGKYGAAVMWSPSYFPIFEARYRAVTALGSLEARLAYARAHGVDYVAAPCATASTSEPLFRRAWLCIYSGKDS
ncbi:hypothetical protein M2360_003917 [Rhizobium sp. SG_E_25_P2]|uniref:hypothetical protein n=1 Tax=Rhizobium sp. SG_E_25_P2 TaxID=2879942 RepID=UPI0024730DD1|nr:hypothetical protein [Rhizobium sp. SG_E_25_P2]MDH6268511.1 hypothetical protein [Rhizobium sp. SG_E_25_P2]